MNDDREDLTDAISQLRVKRSTEGLDESDIDPDPIAQFAAWMQKALDANLRMPNEMTLATADSHGRPVARASCCSKESTSEGLRFSRTTRAARASILRTTLTPHSFSTGLSSSVRST